MNTRRYLIVLLVLVGMINTSGAGTPLDHYVNTPDPSYRYEVVNTSAGKGYTAYIIDMVSQRWRKPDELDRNVWHHWLTIIKPDEISGSTALLFISGGRNGRPAPSKPDERLAKIALASQTVVADLRMVPNQPLIFPDDNQRPRLEDEIIAYTFDKYMNTGDATWPLLLPMVKSAVRALDTIETHMKKVSRNQMNINKFVVSGASKRGWTTWLTAAVDKRVVAIMPLVIDVLNMDEQMRQHYAAYGFYSQSIKDYEEMNVFEKLDTPKGQALIKFVDPYEYRDRFTMPKYMLNSSGDQFFLPDSSQFYFKDLPGEKYLCYLPNTDHSLRKSDAAECMLAFYRSIVLGLPRPQFSWVKKDDGTLEVNTQQRPRQVTLWQAHNAEARDFRLQTIGPAWKSSVLTEQGDGVYVARPPEPEKGWTAFFIELVFNSPTEIPYKFTTEVSVIPDRLPFAETRCCK